MVNLSQMESVYVLSGNFHGELVCSEREPSIDLTVNITPLSKSVVRIGFQVEEMEFNFRGIVRSMTEGNLIYVKDLVTPQYILSGISGFLNQSNDFHGGFINQLDGFYFHVMVNYFTGKSREFYFFGRKIA